MWSVSFHDIYWRSLGNAEAASIEQELEMQLFYPKRKQRNENGL